MVYQYWVDRQKYTVFMAGDRPIDLFWHDGPYTELEAYKKLTKMLYEALEDCRDEALERGER